LLVETKLCVEDNVNHGVQPRQVGLLILSGMRSLLILVYYRHYLLSLTIRSTKALPGMLIQNMYHMWGYRP